jgi:hypothetical protein
MQINNLMSGWCWLQLRRLPRRYTLQRLAILALSTAAFAFTSASASFTPFVHLPAPVGIATDSDGNIYISHDTASETRVTKFNPQGEPLGHVATGGFIDNGVLGTLDKIPSTGVILHLKDTGQLIAIDPDDLAATQLLEIRTLDVDTSAIYDVTSGMVDGFEDMIQPQYATYGDLAVYETPESLDLFITGLSKTQTIPFVMQISILEDGIEARVLMSSRADALALEPQSVRLARGIAVNSQGTVLTSLPLAPPLLDGQTAPMPLDVLMAFEAGFNPSDGVQEGEQPRIILGERIDVYSQGMTADSAGNFYVTTNSTGTAALGVPGEGALVILPGALDRTTSVLSLDQQLTSFKDVAVTRDRGLAYITVGLLNTGSPRDVVVSTPLGAADTACGLMHGISC